MLGTVGTHETFKIVKRCPTRERERETKRRVWSNGDWALLAVACKATGSKPVGGRDFCQGCPCLLLMWVRVHCAVCRSRQESGFNMNLITAENSNNTGRKDWH